MVLVTCNKVSEEQPFNGRKSPGPEPQDLALCSSSATVCAAILAKSLPSSSYKISMGKENKVLSRPQRVVWASAVEHRDINSTSTELPWGKKWDNAPNVTDEMSRETDRRYLLLFAIVRSLPILKLCEREYFVRVPFPRRLTSCYLRSMTSKFTLGFRKTLKNI